MQQLKMRQVLILIETLFSLLYTTLLKMHPGIFLRNANFMPNNWLKMRKLENDNLLIKNHGYGILMGASAFLKSAAFRAFPVNVKTIAPIQICIKLDTQYGVRGRWLVTASYSITVQSKNIPLQYIAKDFQGIRAKV